MRLQILRYILLVWLSVFLSLWSVLVVVIFQLRLLLLILPPASADTSPAWLAPPTDVDSELRSVFALLRCCFLQAPPREMSRMDGLVSICRPSSDGVRCDRLSLW